MFSDKEFVDGANVDLSSGSTAAATADIGTAVTVVGKKRVGNSAVQRTSVTDKPWKQDWIKGELSASVHRLQEQGGFLGLCGDFRFLPTNAGEPLVSD